MNTLTPGQLLANDAGFNYKRRIKQVTLPDGEQVAFEVIADSTTPLRLT